jgi:iron complex transport system substrate-binding protein
MQDRQPPTLRRRLVGVGLLTLALVGVACGGDDASDGATTTAEVGAPAGEAVTVDHRYGTTAIETTPERIVSLDTQWTDVLLALDAPLVGYGVDPNLQDIFPWQEGLLDDTTPITAIDSIPYEQVAALEPDLIVITYFAADEATYERLSEIAPTIPLLTPDGEVDKWEDIAATAGDVLGEQEAAAALVADSEQLSADVLAEHPGLEGRTYALANYVPGDGIYVVADPEDGASTFFGRIGLEIDPEILAAADGATGRVKLSLEQIGMLDSDVLVLLTNGTDTGDIPGFAALPAAQSGAVAVLDVPTVTGLNTPTPLSIPYSLEAIRDALEAAAG